MSVTAAEARTESKLARKRMAKEIPSTRMCAESIIQAYHQGKNHTECQDLQESAVEHFRDQGYFITVSNHGGGPIHTLNWA